MMRIILADSTRHTEEIYRNEVTKELIVYRLTFKVPLKWLGMRIGTKKVYYESSFPCLSDSYDVDKILLYCRKDVKVGRSKKRKMRRNAIKYMKAYEENTI